MRMYAVCNAKPKSFKLINFRYNFLMRIFYTIWKKSRLKSTFLPYRVKKHHSTLEMDTFKGMLLFSYLASLDNKPRTCL